jgi:hypothetical protein
VQRWAATEGAFASVAISTAQKHAGQSSLAGMLAATGAARHSLVVTNPSPAPGPGADVAFHLFVPSGAPIDWVQPFVVESGSFRFTGNFVMNPQLGSWLTLTLRIPADAASSFTDLGVQFHTTAAWSGSVYVDSVSW